jgi:type IV pilus assembly protein PilA
MPCQRRNRMPKQSAFSFIELMIVVAVIVFLTTLAVPNFMRFLAKAKRTEAYVNLSSIYAAEKAYWAEHGRYSAALCGEGGVGWKPEGYTNGGKQERFHYTYGFPGSEGKNYFTGKLEASAGNLSLGRADEKSFVAVAVADIDGDGQPDVLTIDQDNTIKIVQDDLTA